MVATDFPVKRGGASVTYGGAGACMAQLVGGLIESGVEVSVVSRREKGEYSELFDIPVHRTGFLDLGFRSSKISHMFTVQKKLDGIVGDGGFDLIHSHNPPAAYPAQKTSRRNNISHVTTMHGPWADVRLGSLQRFFATMLEEKVLQDADYVTCDSKRLADDVTGWYGLEPNKVKGILNAVESDVFRPDLSSQSKAREKLGFETSDKVVLYTGRFLVEKGINFFLRGIEDVAAKSEGTSFLLVGGGYDEHVVKKWLGKSGLGDRVTVIPYLEYELMPYAYLASDLLVQPSLAEGLSRSILEAMACGLPIIASAVGGNPELVDPDNGLLVPARSGRDLSSAIRKLLSDGKKLKAMGRASRKRACEDFSVDGRVSSFIKVYENLS